MLYGCQLTTSQYGIKFRGEMKDKHPDKDIWKAVQFAIDAGWAVKPGKGHCWGILICSHNDKECRCGEFCRMSVWRTPRSAGNHAKNILVKVNGCIHMSDEDE
ncbi:MAG: hypothetical protein BMS9Abin26_1738 [Gammaproteobacteria bacterium]|nr:MAG: hypothetical protein BMS9Abin26_1738 [Gammaproteobacteria bacterium]